uniref:Putative secreted protein n=1 Tax=Anopheles marajoara TaxID=58244 RepID=A0A2M4C9Z6_9DIPT
MGKIAMTKRGSMCKLFRGELVSFSLSLSVSLANRIGSRCKLIIINLFSIINYLAPFGAHPAPQCLVQSVANDALEFNQPTVSVLVRVVR